MTLLPLVDRGAELNPSELERYSRHLSLPGVGPEGQRRLRNARVLVIGAGGLGSPILNYLAAAGIGHLTVIDDDVVEVSNLQRQTIHRESHVGKPKVKSACDALRGLDARISVEPIMDRLDAQNAVRLFAAHDIVIDGTDNFATRYLANDAAELSGTPLVWGAIFQFTGQVSVFYPGRGPMLRDLFPDIPDADSVPTCAEGGVLGVLCGVIGSVLAAEAIKLICGVGEPLIGRFARYDALTARMTQLRFAPDPDRPAVTALGDYDAACAGSTSATSRDCSPREAQMLLSEDGALLVDVREDWERELTPEPRARAVPLGRIESDGWSALGDLSSTRLIVLMCRSGARSARAVSVLEGAQESAAGVELRSLRGGIEAWLSE